MRHRIKNCIFKFMYISIIIYLMTFIPAIFGYKPLVVISGSMEPKLKVGSILYYHKEDINNFEKGDILVYTTKSYIISHRIVEISEDGFITKGDANKTIDSNEVFKEQVLGKGVNWCIPLLGYYSDYIYHHKYLLYISIYVLIIDLFRDSYKEYKKKVGMKNEKDN